jgi:predicted alpha-1,2-mannosidase
MRTTARSLALLGVLATTASMTACSRTTKSVATDGGADGGTDGGGGAGGGPLAITWREDTPVAPLFIGSGGFGYSFGSASVSATAPNGLVKVGPDTDGPWGTVNFLHYCGYWYGDNIIQGFSHMHLSGTGATDYGVLGVMPLVAFDATKTTQGTYGSTFAKASESAAPGRYAVTLDNGNIGVELTATTHAAHHRYTYPAGTTSAHVVFDLNHHLDGGTITAAAVTLDPTTNTGTGSLHSVGGMSGGFGGYDVYFAIKTNAPWTESQVWQTGAAPAAGTTLTGASGGFELGFDLSQGAGGPVEIQVGLSMVSTAEATANLAAEMPSIATGAFDATQAQTEAAWATLVGRIKFTGGTANQQAMMTAALYHLFLMPSVQSDVDGSFRGMDGMVHTATGYHYQSDMSLWDVYRTLSPMYALIAPEIALDSVSSLYEKARESGFFPKWPIATGEAGTMIGASAEVILGDAYAKGITGYDAEGAYQILRAAALDTTTPPGGRGGRDQVVPYMMYGYVPADVATNSSVALTTEYANDDFGLATLATGLGHSADAATLTARATGYRKLYDPTSGFLWSKNSDGSWASPHDDPTVFTPEFREANAWQSMWMVTQDWEGFGAAAGKAALIAHLEQMFELTVGYYQGIDFSNQLQTGGQPPYYWAGNEPDISAVYLFAALGRPDLTQRWIAWLRASWYTAGADGIPGNDDGGTMSAWLLWSALGIYPRAGSDRYVLGAPLFPEARIAVAGGTFTIDAPGVSDTNLYVQSVTLNGAPLTTPELHHADLKAGGNLTFVMGPSPSAWGQTP